MKRLIFIALILLGTATTRAQILAVKTNALMDLATMPNIGFELVTGNRTALNAEAYFGYKMLGKDWYVQGLTADFRYYPQGKVMDKMFIGVGAMGGHYDMAFKEEGFMGDILGAGITFGWVFHLTEYHWLLEASAGVGLQYYTHEHRWLQDFKETRSYNQRGLDFMPYKIGVSVSYIFQYKNEVDSKVGRKLRKQRKAEEKARKNNTALPAIEPQAPSAAHAEGTEATEQTPVEGVNNLQQENQEDREHTTT